MIIAGIDLALEHSGWAHVAYEDGRLLATGVIHAPPSLTLDQRLAHIAGAAQAVITESVTNVAIEDCIVHRSGTTTRRIAMVHGAVRLALTGRAPIVPVNVTELKAWACGGRADKAAMQAEAKRRFGRDLTHDEADAALAAAWLREQIIASIEEGA